MTVWIPKLLDEEELVKLKGQDISIPISAEELVTSALQSSRNILPA